MYLNNTHHLTQLSILSVVDDILWIYDFDFNKFLFVDLGWRNDEIKIIADKARQKYRFEMHDNILYRVPWTLTIAYNETHLFSPDIRLNCAHIYVALECKDPVVIITNFLFELLTNDYSLYKCANL